MKPLLPDQEHARIDREVERERNERQLNDEARATSTPLRVVVDQERPVMRPIRTMGLDDVLSMYGTVDEAVAG